MPKKETNPAVEKNKAPKMNAEEKAALKAEAKAKKEAEAAKHIFTYKGESEKKLAPQAAQIVELVKGAGKKGITRPDLLTAMESVVTTKQPIGRILSYYQKSLVDAGCVEITK